MIILMLENFVSELVDPDRTECLFRRRSVGAWKMARDDELRDRERLEMILSTRRRINNASLIYQKGSLDRCEEPLSIIEVCRESRQAKCPQPLRDHRRYRHKMRKKVPIRIPNAEMATQR